MTRTIQEITLIDVDERCAPPERVAVIGMVDSLLHIEIAKYDETHTKRWTETQATICLDARSFYEAFMTLWRDEFRPSIKLGPSEIECEPRSEPRIDRLQTEEPPSPDVEDLKPKPRPRKKKAKAE